MVIPRSLREEVGVSEGAILNVAGREGSRKQLLRDLAAVVDEIRQEAKERGIDKMPVSEIDSAVASARKSLSTKTAKRPVK